MSKCDHDFEVELRWGFHARGSGREALLELAAPREAIRDLFRLRALRRRLPDHAVAHGQAAKEIGGPASYNIVFVTIDPTHDGPKEVGQYAGLFNSPIIGLTGSPAQIDQVKKRYGIYAEPSPHPMPGKEMMHSAIVLLFDHNGRFVATIAPDEPDADALTKLRKLLV